MSKASIREQSLSQTKRAGKGLMHILLLMSIGIGVVFCDWLKETADS